MDRRDKVLRKARKSKSDTDWQLYKNLRKFCNNRLKSARKNYHRNLLNESRMNPRNFSKTIKSIFPTKSAKNCKTRCSAKSFGTYFESAVSNLKKLHSFWRILPGDAQITTNYESTLPSNSIMFQFYSCKKK